MSSVTRLEQALSRALSVSLGAPEIPAVLRKTIDDLQKALGGLGRGRPPRDRLREAVFQFRATGEWPDLATARAVCFGAGDEFLPEQPLIEERELFSRLLDGLEQYRPDPRRFRRCYRGLLHTYFAYDGECNDKPPTGRRNWAFLRDYLGNGLASLGIGAVQPEWVEALEAHPNLLTEDPAGRYGPDLIEGRTAVSDQLRAALEISDASWLMRKIVLSPVAMAARESDQQFRARVQSLLGILQIHKFLEDEGLALILDRYAKSEAPDLHAALRDRSVECWGNPFLQRNKARWSRVSKEARALVTTWVKLDLIKQFFEVFSDDRDTDKRRVRFWMKYHDFIDDMFFALGGAAMNSRVSDVKDLRGKMGDHLLSLTGPASSRNNAFVMLMGGVVVVEFGASGNACFIFKRESLPFVLSGSVRGDSSELKHASHLARLIHVDSGEKWEKSFESVLDRFGVRQGSTGGENWRQVWATTASTARPVRAFPGVPEVRGAVTREMVARFCEDRGMVYSDNTSVGGNFIVLHQSQRGEIAEQLLRWSFKFSAVRRFWWRKEWL